MQQVGRAMPHFPRAAQPFTALFGFVSGAQADAVCVAVLLQKSLAQKRGDGVIASDCDGWLRRVQVRTVILDTGSSVFAVFCKSPLHLDPVASYCRLLRVPMEVPQVPGSLVKHRYT
eukprot:1627634-Rhodomonas_salina.2